MRHQEYQGPDEAGEPHLGGIEQLMRDELGNSIVQTAAAGKKTDDDDLGLALDALRDCDNEFSKFVQVRQSDWDQ